MLTEIEADGDMESFGLQPDLHCADHGALWDTLGSALPRAW